MAFLARPAPRPAHCDSRSTGFSLVELIAVIVVLGVISFVALPRFANTDAAAVQSARDQALSAFFTAQQLAMSRGGQDNPVALVVSAGQIDVTEGGASVNQAGANFPFNLPEGVRITAGVGRYDYDKLGRTQPGEVTFAKGSTSATLVLEASGYAYYRR